MIELNICWNSFISILSNVRFENVKFKKKNAASNRSILPESLFVERFVLNHFQRIKFEKVSCRVEITWTQLFWNGFKAYDPTQDVQDYS